MTTRSIPRPEWTQFLDRFSRDHLEETATVEVVGQELGDQLIAEEQTFHGISADEKDGENRIAIMLGGDGDQSVTHSVMSPSEVWLKDDDSKPSLEIRTSDDSAWLITFVPSTLPSV